MDDEPVVKKVIEEVKERRLFINNMNSRLPRQLIDELRKDGRNKFCGTILPEGRLPVNFYPKVIKIDSTNNYEHPDLFSNNFFVYFLDTANFQEIEYIIKGLKTKVWDEDKYLILISNIMTWAKTGQKIKEEPADEKADDNADENDNKDKDERIDDEPQPQTNSDEKEEDDDLVQEPADDADAANMDNKDDDPKNEETPVKYLYFKDKDYKLRMPASKYFLYKSIETLAMSSSATNKRIKCNIVCPGFIYGDGEDFFYNYFRVSLS